MKVGESLYFALHDSLRGIGPSRVGRTMGRQYLKHD